MSITKTPLQPGRTYHIYNKSLDARIVFRSEEHYKKMLQLMKKYMPAAYNVYAYCLLPNHFHFLICIKTDIIEKPHLPLGHMLNSYSQYFNKHQKRHGPLFQRPFKRKLITNRQYLWQLVCYIHHNPFHHQLSDYKSYAWSSYSAFRTSRQTVLCREKVFDFFGGRKEFFSFHEDEAQYRGIRDSLLEYSK